MLLTIQKYAFSSNFRQKKRQSLYQHLSPEKCNKPLNLSSEKCWFYSNLSLEKCNKTVDLSLEKCDKKNQKKGHIKTDFCDIKDYLGI